MGKIKKFKSYSKQNRVTGLIVIAFIAIAGSTYLLFARAATTASTLPLTSSAVIASKTPTVAKANPSILQTTGLGNSIGGYRSFLKFNVATPSPTDVITKVQLKVYTQTANSAGFYVKSLADSSWDPTKITYNSHPTIGSTIADSSATKVNTWKTIDLTKYVTAKGLVSFVLYPKDGYIIQYSNAGTTAPQLVVDYTPATIADTTAPTNVAITAPTSGATVTGTYSFASSATDETGVAKVEFYNDSKLIGNAGPNTATSWVIYNTTTSTYGFDTKTLTDGTHSIYSIAYDAAGNKTQSTPVSYTVNNATQPPVSTSGPIRIGFYYPWFPETWGKIATPNTHFNPTAGFYSSDTASVITKHIQQMTYAGLDAAVASWWGQGQHSESTRIPALLNNSANTSNGKNLKWALYYEKESTGDPAVADITSDLTYIKTNYAGNANYLQIGGKPVIFVFTDGNDACAMAQRWHDANTVGFYVVLKVFSGYTACTTQPDGWHQYGPASATDSQGKYSYTISPGFWLYTEAAPRLARLSAADWTTSVNNMVASKAQFQLVTTFNEWGEGTAVEPANEWASASGYGTYIDILHQILNANAPTPVDTTAPTAPSNLTATLASSASKTVNLSWTASSDNVGGSGLKQYTVSRTDSANNKVSFNVTAPTATYSDSSAIYNTQYTYSVTASDNAVPANVSSASNSVSVTTPSQPVAAPATPTNLSGSAISSTQINLTWTASVDTTGIVGGYKVFRNGTQIADTKSIGTAYSDTGLTGSTSYSYTVLAYDSVTTTLQSAQTAAVSVTTPPTPQVPVTDTTPPSIPTSVLTTLATATGKTVNVTWGASTDNAGGSGLKQYVITRTDSANTVVQFTVAAGTLNYADSSTNFATTYNYTVAAQDNASPTNTSVASAPVSVTTPKTPDTTAPNVPAAPSAIIVSSAQVTIAWNAVTDNPTDGTASGVAGYRVFRNGTQIADVTTTSVNDSMTFVSGQGYTWTVLAYDVSGNLSAQSSASASTIPNPVIATSSYCNNPATGNKINTVIVIAMENRTWSGGATAGVGMGFNATNMPYTHNLAASCTYFQSDTEINTGDNSAQQYVGAWTGYTATTTKVSADCSPSATCSYTGNNIFRAFRSLNIPHREYVEGATAACSASGNAAKHIPELYMYDVTDKANCANEVLPMSQFSFAAPPTGFTFITPTLCNDGHDCSDTVVDNWLKDPTRLPALFNTAAYKSGQVMLEIWYDEDHAKPNTFACWSCKQSVVPATTDPTYAGESQLWLNLLGAPTTNLGGITNGLDIRTIVGTP